ncbi:MAG: hypothetical protein KAU95_03845 [Candidatus Aenigmarchaeota archaeon]|nr:hypothetical protein [Candidatus Aenigmarchaeota archaeon]
MKNKTKDKTGVALAGIITALIIFALLLYAGEVLTKGEILKLVFPVGIIIIIGLLMIPFVKRRYFDVKKGVPFEDERSKKMMNRAAACAFYISLYWLLAIGYASSNEWIHFRDISHATNTGIIGMAIIFGICYLHYNRKGDAE